MKNTSNQIKEILVKIASILCIFTLIAFTAKACEKKLNTKTVSNKIHNCNWKDCKWVNKPIDEKTFISKYGNEEYTDSWCIELTHYTNPKLTYEQCEDYVFAGVE